MDPRFLSAKRQAGLIRRGAIDCRALLDDDSGRVPAAGWTDQYDRGARVRAGAQAGGRQQRMIAVARLLKKSWRGFTPPPGWE